MLSSNDGLFCLDRLPGIAGRLFEETLVRPTAGDDEEDALLCAFCHHLITSNRDRTTVNDQHRHQCTNPAGITFRIGCFRRAPGCRATGLPTTEHTWFPGHAWQIALCAGCHSHLGWRFVASDGSGFFGLILAHLVARGPASS